MTKDGPKKGKRVPNHSTTPNNDLTRLESKEPQPHCQRFDIGQVSPSKDNSSNLLIQVETIGLGEFTHLTTSYEVVK